jgi:hypothetical protein
MKHTINSLLFSLLFTTFIAGCNPQEVPPGSENPPQDYPQERDPDQTPTPTPTTYIPWGVGGGGAMSGVAISPYTNLWFVGTDMGTLFRSTDYGKSWNAVNHHQTTFSSDLTKAVSPGFAADGSTVFHCFGGVNPQRSLDGGLTFNKISMGLTNGELIKYWHSDSSNSNLVFAGTTKGFLRSENKGQSWIRATGINEEAVGTYVDLNGSTKKTYTATKSGIWVSADEGKSFTKFHTPSNVLIRQFTGGRDSKGVTLAYMDNDGQNACSWIYSFPDWGQNAMNDTISTCGYVWIGSSDNNFSRTAQAAGDHIKMAENDSDTIYVTGGRKWIRQYGTKIHVSHDKGASWNLKLNQINWDVVPYAPWPSSKLEWSAVALDIGWWDSGYESFEVNRRNSNIAAGSGYFFLHSTLNAGENWLAPFTEYKDTGTPAAQKKWNTRGIEVITVYRTKFHPRNSNLLYAASADIGGVISEDGGNSFRVSAAKYNSNYDYSFDLNNDNVVYAASGNSHDYPNDWHANAIKSAGGIYRSDNRGRSWTRLTPDNSSFNRQFLSVGYDSINKFIYGGSHEVGIARSSDNGKTWNWFNNGLPNGNKIIPQIEVDPRTGNVYALLTGNAPEFTNQAQTGIYFLDVQKGATSWTLLRGTVHYPPEADRGYKVWYYPTAFAIDFESGNDSDIWLVDYENNRNWLMTGVWKTTDRGNNWHRVQQMTHPVGIAIDPHDSKQIHVSGFHQLDGNWGVGGQIYSKDGGFTWKKNEIPPLQHNSRGVTIHPEDSKKIIYTYLGGGMLYGPNPSYL